MLQAFSVLDTNDDGHLTQAEIRKMIQPNQQGFESFTAQDALKLYDLNEDGQVSYEEFNTRYGCTRFELSANGGLFKFECCNKKCISGDKTCDGINTCGDNSDEERSYCESSSCCKAIIVSTATAGFSYPDLLGQYEFMGRRFKKSAYQNEKNYTLYHYPSDRYPGDHTWLFSGDSWVAKSWCHSECPDDEKCNNTWKVLSSDDTYLWTDSDLNLRCVEGTEHSGENEVSLDLVSCQQKSLQSAGQPTTTPTTGFNVMARIILAIHALCFWWTH